MEWFFAVIKWNLNSTFSHFKYDYKLVKTQIANKSTNKTINCKKILKHTDKPKRGI